MLMSITQSQCDKIDIDQHHDYEEDIMIVLIISYIVSPLFDAIYTYEQTTLNYNIETIWLSYMKFGQTIEAVTSP